MVAKEERKRQRVQEFLYNLLYKYTFPRRNFWSKIVYVIIIGGLLSMTQTEEVSINNSLAIKYRSRSILAGYLIGSGLSAFSER